MMDLKQILRDEITLDEEVGIYSVHGLPPGDYDNKAAAYDAVIAAPLYNKMMWGNSPSDYLNFAKHSLQQQSCLLYTSPSPRDLSTSRMPSSA